MPRPALLALLGLAAVVCAALGLLVAPVWLLGVPAAVVAALTAWVGPDRFLRAVDGDGDPGTGPAGLHP